MAETTDSTQNPQLYPDTYPYDVISQDMSLEEQTQQIAFQIRKLQELRLRYGQGDLRSQISAQNQTVPLMMRLPSLQKMLDGSSILPGRQGDVLIQEQRYASLQGSIVSIGELYLEQQEKLISLQAKVLELEEALISVTATMIPG